MDPTPISAVAAAWQATMAMVTRALPSDEQRLVAFQLRYPKRYARLRIWIENRIYKQICSEVRRTPVTYEIIANYVDWDNSELSATEQNSLIAVLCDRFNVSAK